MLLGRMYAYKTGVATTATTTTTTAATTTETDTDINIGSELDEQDKEAVAITATRIAGSATTNTTNTTTTPSNGKETPYRKPDLKITPHGHAQVHRNRNSIETANWNINNQKYQLSFAISAQLISYIYSSMVG